MASYVLFMKDEREFYNKLKERDFDMIYKMVKSILHAIKYKKSKLDVFEVVFKDTSILTFTVEKDQYLEVIQNCLEDMIKAEQYEVCAKMRDALNKKTRKKKEELSN